MSLILIEGERLISAAVPFEGKPDRKLITLDGGLNVTVVVKLLEGEG